MICESCGGAAPTRYVEFYQNIGAVVMRFHKAVKGNLCRTCIRSHFLRLTGTTLVLGWWGLISFFVTPFFLANNVYRYLASLDLEPVLADAGTMELSREAVDRLHPLAGELVARLSAGQKINEVAREIAGKAGVTPGQVLAYVRYLSVVSRR
jgi:hypothetical protein